MAWMIFSSQFGYWCDIRRGRILMPTGGLQAHMFIDVSNNVPAFDILQMSDTVSLIRDDFKPCWSYWCRNGGLPRFILLNTVFYYKKNWLEYIFPTPAIPIALTLAEPILILSITVSLAECTNLRVSVYACTAENFCIQGASCVHFR